MTSIPERGGRTGAVRGENGMRRQIMSRFVMGWMIAAVLLCVGQGKALAETRKKEPAKKNSPPAADAKIPVIRAINIIENRDGEALLASPLSLALDTQNGDLLVANFESEEVAIFDSNGTLIKRMGAETGLRSPYGVAIDGAGQIFVSELKTGFLKIFNSAGMTVDEIDLGKALGRTVAPGRITIGRDGLLYLADLKENEILIFTGRGDFVRSLGKFDFLQKAGTARDGRVIGLSAMGTAVQFFAADGKKLSSFGKHGDEPRTNFSFPTGFAVDDRGRLWIADPFQHRLTVYTPEGKFLFSFGRMEEKKGDGGLFFPVDLCFGKNGTLYLLEKGANRLRIYQVSDLKE